MRTKKPSIEATVAPAVDHKWASDFIVGLRLQGVDGPEIGAALAEANDYVATSGLSAQEAFGYPWAYAASLQLPKNPANAPSEIVKTLVFVALMVGASYLTFSSTTAVFRHDTQAMIPWVLLPLMLVMLAFAGSGRALTWAFHGKPQTAALGIVTGAIWMGVVLAGRFGFYWPTPVVAGLAVLLWVAGFLGYFRLRVPQIQEEARWAPITPPTDHNADETMRRSITSTRRAIVALPLTMLGITAVVVIVLYFLA